MTIKQTIKYFEDKVRFCERALTGDPVHTTTDWTQALEANKAALEALKNAEVVLGHIEGERQIYKAALDVFGDSLQISKLFEEIGEFMDAFCKCIGDRDTVTHVAEEIADMTIMLAQMAVMLDCEDDVERKKVCKLARLEKRIEEAKNMASMKLSDIPTGGTFKIGEHEMIVLEHSGDTTAVICKDLLVKNKAFGKNNNYDGSDADMVCNGFVNEIAAVVGAESLVEHTVDLTSDDGLRDYGTIRRRASLFTTDLYRRYVAILDKYKIDAWWWLATPHSTPTHENASWVKCVSPSGGYCNCYCRDDFVGVRPFCILKSNIFVSK